MKIKNLTNFKCYIELQKKKCHTMGAIEIKVSIEDSVLVELKK